MFSTLDDVNKYKSANVYFELGKWKGWIRLSQYEKRIDFLFDPGPRDILIRTYQQVSFKHKVEQRNWFPTQLYDFFFSNYSIPIEVTS
jgi:hypothetical protein